MTQDNAIRRALAALGEAQNILHAALGKLGDQTVLAEYQGPPPSDEEIEAWKARAHDYPIDTHSMTPEYVLAAHQIEQAVALMRRAREQAESQDRVLDAIRSELQEAGYHLPLQEQIGAVIADAIRFRAPVAKAPASLIGSPAHVELWDAIHEVVEASGGMENMSVARQNAVAHVEDALAKLVGQQQTVAEQAEPASEPCHVGEDEIVKWMRKIVDGRDDPWRFDVAVMDGVGLMRTFCERAKQAEAEVARLTERNKALRIQVDEEVASHTNTAEALALRTRENERLRAQWAEFREWLAEQGERAFQVAEEHETAGDCETSARYHARGRIWVAAVMEADRRMEAKGEQSEQEDENDG